MKPFPLSYFRAWQLWIVLLCIVTSLTLLAWVSYQNRFALNPDGVSYISIAQHYAAGDITFALNAYWSPLLSWLMTPFIKAGLSGQEAFSIINFFTAGFILLFGSWFCQYITANWRATTLYFLCTLPFLVHLMTTQITPDGLVIAWILAAVAILYATCHALQRNIKQRQLALLVCGVAFFGFIGYVTKLYLQPVFIGALILSVAYFSYYLYTKKNKALLRQLLTFSVATFGAYAILCLAWIIPLSIKYEQITIGSSYTFNTGTQGLPQTRLLLAPPHDAALTAWEDPTLLVEHQHDTESNSAQSSSVMSHLKKTYFTLPDFIEKVGGLWVLLFAPIIAAALYLATRHKVSPLSTTIASSLLLFLVYIGGYAARGGIGNHRYQWPLLVISILLAALLSVYLWQYITKQRLHGAARIATGLVLLLLPFTLFLQYTPYPHHYLRPSEKPELQIVAEEIRERNIIPQHQTIAASDFGTATHLSYYLDTPTYGTFDPSYSLKDKEARTTLAEHNIGYFIDVTSPAAKNNYGKNSQLLYSYELDDYCDGACQLNVVMLDNNK